MTVNLSLAGRSPAVLRLAEVETRSLVRGTEGQLAFNPVPYCFDLIIESGRADFHGSFRFT
jgi:hypothetical protein